MNILVINPANKPFTNKSIIAEPIDVLNIATIIKQEYDYVTVIDMDLNDMNNDISNYLKEDNRTLVAVTDYKTGHLPTNLNNIIYGIIITEIKRG